MLELDLQKVTTFVSRPFRLMQGDKGYIQPFHLSVGFAPYSATADTLCFAGTKPDGQVIEVEAEPSRFSKDGDTWFFYLPDEVAQAIGTFEAYFYVKKGNSIVASTTKFAYEVGAKFGDDEASNSYVSVFNSLRDKFNQIIESSRTELNNWTSLNNQARADLDKLLKDLKTQTDNWLSAKSSEIQGIITNYNSKYNELVGKWNNQITTQQNEYAAQKAKIDSEYKQQLENLKSQLNSEWQQQKQAQQASFDSFKADLTNRISQAKSDIDSIQTVIPTLQKKIAEISLNSFSEADTRSTVSDQVTEIAGNLIDPNLNNWTKNTQAQQAFKSINFDGTTNDINYQGVGGIEMIWTKINPELYKHYKVRFRFTPKSDIRDLSNGYAGTIGFCVYRTDPTRIGGNWGAEQGNDNTTTQIKLIAINQDKFYEFGFYSDNATELYIGFNFNDVKDIVSSNFSISSISVVNIDNTIQSITDSSYPRKSGSAGDDLFSYKNNHEIRIYDNISDVKNKPSSASNWFVAVIDTVRNSWGSIKVFCPGVGSWQIDLAGGNWNSWFTLSDSRNTYSKSEIDAQINKYVGKNIVNISNPMFYSTKSVDDFTAMGSPNNTQTLTVYRSDFSANDNGKPGLANYSQGLIFGAWNGRGVLSISNNTKERKARISGGTYDNSNYPIWSEDIAWKSDFANYYNKSETDTKTSNLQGQLDSYKAQVSSLQTQLSTLQSQMSNLLRVINVSNGSLNVTGSLIVKHGNIQNYWGGVDQYVAYSPSGVRRGYFGVWDNGTFNARVN